MTVAGPERRKPGASRVPFEALVEIAAPEGASFEAESVDLSAAGMHLRTAYLPKVGTPLRFRFEPGEGDGAVVVDGEVVWSQDGGGSCEFGVRFAEIAGRDAEAIERIVRAKPSAAQGMGAKPGAPVRIHIEGMAAPMRATLRDDASKGAIVGSELKMLKLGAMVELEDKERGTRRTARVDGVDCEIDPGTRVPQLVVKLRYPDAAPSREAASDEVAFAPTAKAPMPAEVETAAREIRTTLHSEPPSTKETVSSPAPSQARVALPVGEGTLEEDETAQAQTEQASASEQGSHLEDVKDGVKVFSTKMRDVLGGAAATAQSSLKKIGARMGTTVALLAKKKSEGGEGADTARRTTSSFVAGSATGNGKPRALRQQGGSRDVGGDVRMHGEDEEAAMQEIEAKRLARRRQIGIAAGVALAVILGFFAFRKPAPTQPIVQAPAPELAPAPVAAPIEPMAAPVDSALAVVEPAPAVPLIGESTGLDAKGHPNPFGTPSVKKGTKMLLRLDGPVAEIKGMQMPNGFVVSVPNRKSLEAAGPLAAKDTRITSAKVVNQPGGAELTIAFKDGASPSYAVRAKGDAIEIVLASEKSEKHLAKKDKGKGGKPAKHAKKKKK